MKSFSFMLKNLISLLLVGSLVACGTLKRKSGDKVTGVQETDVSQEQEDLLESMPEIKKLGVILGPGFLKSYAHLGVLKELESNDIELHQISGIGWGAIVAAGFAQKARSSELEWQMFKMDEKILPSKELFGSKWKAQEISKLDPFLKSIFRDNRIESTELKFSCQATNLRTFSSRNISHGRFVDELKRCIAGNSFYKDYRNWIWDPMSLQELMANMRNNGAEKILIVDVIDPEDYSTKNKSLNSLMDYYVWGKSDRLMGISSSKVDYYLQVRTNGIKMNDPAKLRELVRRGRKAAQSITNKISQEVMGR